MEPEELKRFFGGKSILVRKWEEKITNKDEHVWCIVSKDENRRLQTARESGSEGVENEYVDEDEDSPLAREESEEIEGMHSIKIVASFVEEETIARFIEFLKEGTDKRISKIMSPRRRLDFLKLADYLDVIVDGDDDDDDDENDDERSV
jgi:hypothetical protein